MNTSFSLLIVTVSSFLSDYCKSYSMSSEWSSEIWLAEAVANSVHINSLVPVNGKQLSQLMVACLHGNIDYFEALLKVPGVKVDLQNDEGRHALYYACKQGHTEIAQLILNTCQCPKDLVNLPDKRENTSLVYLGTLKQFCYYFKMVLM